MIDQVKGKVKGIEDDALNQNVTLIERLKHTAGVETDAELAKILDIKPQNVTQAKRRGVPSQWIIKISKLFNCDLNILFADGPGYNETENQGSFIGKPVQYGVPVEMGRKLKPGLGEAVDRLNKVLSSGEDSTVSALASVLIAFEDAVETKQKTRDKLAQLEKKSDDQEAEITRLKNELERFDKILEELAELKKAIQNISRLYHESARPGAEERRNIIHHLGKILADVGINGNQLSNNL